MGVHPTRIIWNWGREAQTIFSRLASYLQLAIITSCHKCKALEDIQQAEFHPCLVQAMASTLLARSTPPLCFLDNAIGFVCVLMLC